MLSQTILQVAPADPGITLDSLRAACREVIDAGKDQAQLIDALLALARSQRGLDHREPVDLAAVVNDALDAQRDQHRTPVPPDQASRLLEPFQRAAPDRTASPDGLGLGLSIVADIAKAHGADLEVRPRPEGGLTVAVNFP
jgi:signal transduction histidine kinase